ncbi:hypothetical protein N7486_004176 [Penicillium sp. IBT 16267x]|nr:hypothetical protein N7486_004176 [Penicillium sp. IBT 16267x]
MDCQTNFCLESCQVVADPVDRVIFPKRNAVVICLLARLASDVRKWRRLRPNDQSTQSEELSKYETETQQDCSGAIQPAIQRTDTGDPDVDITSSKRERAEVKAIPKDRCHLKSTRDEVDNDHLPILANATLPDAEWTRPYFEMTLPTDLPSRVTIPPQTSSLATVEEQPHTIHQLLLVLNYLFVSVMLPGDDGALWFIIHRCERDWEKSFILQYDSLLWWLVSARNALTRAADLHCMSLEDLELQIRYILFILGQHASPKPSFFHTYQRPDPPYRPFGVRSSIALICHAFMGIHAAGIGGYQFKELWIRDQEFFCTMTSRLQKSPLFPAEVPVHKLQSIILSLQSAFQLEEIRVASTKPQAICIGDGPDRMEYYRRAFLSLDPMLLPRILTTALAIEPKFEVRIDDLATLLAERFHESYPMEDLEAAFKKVPEIWQSKSDRIVVTEMFHVKTFEQEYRLGYLVQMARLMFWFFMFPWGLAGNPVLLISVVYEQS